jgi:hypothetical protein
MNSARALIRIARLLAVTSFVLALAACDAEQMMVVPENTSAPDGPLTATVKFCNEADVELTLMVGEPGKALFLVAQPHQCSSGIDQPCGRAPAGLQALSLLRGRVPIASQPFGLQEGEATLVMARAESSATPHIALVKLSSEASCSKQDPFASVPDGESEPPTCRDLKNCHRQCGQDASCHAACDHRATPEVKGRFDAVEACARANNCRDEGCIAQRCAKELSACPVSDPQPELTCRELKNCRLECRDSTCAATCDAKASPAARAAYTAAMSCVQENGCKDDGCASSKCGALVEACLGK